MNLHVEPDKFLDEYNLGAVNSCMGGIVLHCRKGRIVCANTIDERLQLVYQIALPDIRKDLFPSIIAAQNEKHHQHLEGQHKEDPNVKHDKRN